ncbi:ATP-binding protein [Uniformispora flossi]|uniref:ATP-binding protein n=1 Tax=Uniformispora flossi TaxID=3390723 RepID=UPI003C2B9720
MTNSRGTLHDNRRATGFTLPPPRQRRRLRLAGTPRPVARARAFAAQALADWSWPGDATDADHDVVLLAAELVANAAMHADGALELVVEFTGTRMRIEVADGSPVLPAPRRPHRPGVPGGHGLFIVRRSSDRWGASRHAHGKTVWAEIDAA